MKNLILFLLLFCFVSATAQNISGFYAGKLLNDSTGKEQQYELALSEYRGNITGYSYTTFIVADSFYYSIKRIKAQRKNGTLEVEDVKMLANNFPRAADRGVRQVMRIPLNEGDSLTEIKGTWSTTRTKVYYAIGGAMDMRREEDSSRLALVRHLYDIGEWKTPAYSQPTAARASAKATEARTAKNKQQPTNAAKENNAIKTTEPDANKVAIVQPYSSRREQVTQNFTAVSDSLVLHFYDNGMVDGDTISVYLNGANIIQKVKLTAAAARQTIRLNEDTDVYKLVLVAENLGTIPPNTGLLVIQDGSNRYQVHFTADLQTNAAIEFRRKPR